MTAPASVTRSKGETIAVSVAEFLPNSLMLKALPTDLEFREKVRVELFGFTVAGEVVFAGNQEAAVVFDTSPEVFEAIEAFEDFVHAAGDNAAGSGDLPESTSESDALAEDSGDLADPTTYDAPPIESDDLPEPTATVDIEHAQDGWDALPEVDAQGKLQVHGELERLGLLLGLRAGRPQLVKSEQPIARVVMTEGDHPLTLLAISSGGQGYVVPPPMDFKDLDAAIGQLRGVFDEAFGVAPREAPKEADDGLPRLRADGTVEYSSRAQFDVQRRVNLANGAVMAVGASIPIGSRRSLRLVIPGAEPVRVSVAEVVFNADGKIGFEISDLEGLKNAIAQSLSEDTREARRRRPSSRSRAPAKPPFDYVAVLRGMPNARAFIRFRDGETDDLSGAGGWYVGLIDRVLRSGRDAVVKVAKGEDTLKIWIVGGRVVAVERTPPPDKDRLGARLVTTRAIDTATLDVVLRRAESEKRPIGQVILDSGSVTRTDMNRALRKQIMERTLVACEWEEGRIEVGAWSEPPFDADLLAVRGEAVTTSLLRKQLQFTRLATLREELASFNNKPAVVDLAKIYEAYRLTDREQRFYARGADMGGTLSTLVSMSSTRPLEGYRLALLGAALGFVTLSDAPKSRP